MIIYLLLSYSCHLSITFEGVAKYPYFIYCTLKPKLKRGPKGIEISPFKVAFLARSMAGTAVYGRLTYLSLTKECNCRTQEFQNYSVQLGRYRYYT